MQLHAPNVFWPMNSLAPVRLTACLRFRDTFVHSKVNMLDIKNRVAIQKLGPAQLSNSRVRFVSGQSRRGELDVQQSTRVEASERHGCKEKKTAKPALLALVMFLPTAWNAKGLHALPSTNGFLLKISNIIE